MLFRRVHTRLTININKMWILLFLFFLAILVRVLVGLHGYSGYNKPPMFGDYEAQRHWMEITNALPSKDWYVETPDNQLQYAFLLF